MKPVQLSSFAILLVNFISSLGFSLVIPFLVILTTRFGGNAIMYGIIGSIYPLSQLIASPFLGRWSDVYGRKPILVISEIGTFLAWLIFLYALYIPVTILYKVPVSVMGAFAITIPLLLITFARVVDGITGSNVSVAQAYIADISTDKDRNKYYGRLSVASNIGFIVGPGLAGILGSTILAEKLPIIVALIISAITLILIIFLLPESHHRVTTVKQEHIAITKILRNPNIRLLLLLYLLLYVGFSIFYTAFPVYAIGALKWSVGKMGLYFSALSLMMVIVQGPVLSFLSKRYSDSVLAIIGTAILGVNFLLIASGNDILIYLAAACFAVGNGIMWPSILSLVSKVAGTYQGTVQGITTSAGSLASIIGLLLGGILYAGLHQFAFLIAALVIFSVLLFSAKLLTIART